MIVKKSTKERYNMVYIGIWLALAITSTYASNLHTFLSVDFGIDYLTFLIDFGARRSRESNWRADKVVHMLSKKSTHHPCTTVADRRHCSTYPEALATPGLGCIFKRAVAAYCNR